MLSLCAHYYRYLSIRCREELLTTIKKMEEAKVRADETLRKIPDEGMITGFADWEVNKIIIVLQKMSGKKGVCKSKKKITSYKGT